MRQTDVDEPPLAHEDVNDPVNKDAHAVAELFGLPLDEELLGYFTCALRPSRSRFLRQGTLYIFSSHVCFRSNVFGSITSRKIPYKDINSIDKKTFLALPSALQIKWVNKSSAELQRDFFASFLSRDKAFAALQLQVEKARLNGHTSAAAPDAADDIKSSTGPDSVPAAQLVSPAVAQGDHLADLPAAAARRPKPPPGTRHASNSDSASNCSSDEEEEHQDVFGAVEPRSQDSWTVQDRLAPDRADDQFSILQCDLPCSVREFFDVALSDGSAFTDSFLLRCGCVKKSLHSWETQRDGSAIRQLVFKVPLEVPLGVRKVHCIEDQRYSVYKGDHLVYECSQRLLDLPTGFGKGYTSVFRWDVEPVQGGEPGSPPMTRLAMYMATRFEQFCMLKSHISRRSLENNVVHSKLLVRAITEFLEVDYDKVVFSQRPLPPPSTLPPGGSVTSPQPPTFTCTPTSSSQWPSLSNMSFLRAPFSTSSSSPPPTSSGNGASAAPTNSWNGGAGASTNGGPVVSRHPIFYTVGEHMVEHDAMRQPSGTAVPLLHPLAGTAAGNSASGSSVTDKRAGSGTVSGTVSGTAAVAHTEGVHAPAPQTSGPVLLRSRGGYMNGPASSAAVAATPAGTSPPAPAQGGSKQSGVAASASSLAPAHGRAEEGGEGKVGMVHVVSQPMPVVVLLAALVVLLCWNMVLHWRSMAQQRQITDLLRQIAGVGLMSSHNAADSGN